MQQIIINIAIVATMEALASIVVPEGRMKKFVLSVLSLFLFFSIVYPLCQLLGAGGLENLLTKNANFVEL